MFSQKIEDEPEYQAVMVFKPHRAGKSITAIDLIRELTRAGISIVVPAKAIDRVENNRRSNQED